MEVTVKVMPIRAALLGLIAATAVSGAAFAGSCVSGSISTYLTVANGGTAPDGFSCTVGDKSFSDFTFLSTAGGSGLAVTQSELSVSPQTTLAGFGLLFSSGAIEIDNTVTTNPALSFVDVSLGYTVTAPNPPDIKDADLVVAGGTTGGGTARVDETLTPGGTLTVIIPTTTDMINISPPVASLDVLKDVLVEVPANTLGDANITAIGQHFSQTTVPEPATLAIIGVGLLGLSIARRRRRV
jgi:hypothetical protein